MKSRRQGGMKPHRAMVRHAARRGVFRLSLLALLLGGGAAAQAQTWSGLGPTNNWGDPLNWSGIVLPASSTATSLTFAGTLRLAPVQNIASVFDLGSMTFAAGAGAFSLSGNTLRFAAPISNLVQNSSNAVTIANNVQVAANLVYSGNGSLTLNGQLSRSGLNTAANTVLTKRGNGRLTLGSTNTFDGSVVIEAGQVRLGQAQSLASATVVINVNGGLDLNGLPTATLGNLSGSGLLSLGTTQLTVGGNGSSPAAFTADIRGAAGSSVTKAGSGTTVLAGGLSIFDTLKVNQGTVSLRNTTLQMNSASLGLIVGSGVPGDSGGPLLELIDGAVLQAPGETMQVDGAAGTRLQIAGAGSQMSTGFQALIGNHAQGSVTVADGGSLQAGTYLIAGVDNGGVGVIGASDGGQISSTNGLLGMLPGSHGTATIEGAGSRWTTYYLGLGGLNVGQNGGTGVLNVTNDGVVRVSGYLKTWTADSRAIVNGGSLSVGQLESNGTLGGIELVQDPSFGPALTIEGNGGAASFAGMISGSGTLLKTGTLAQTLSNANSFSGRTVINGGSILLGHAQALQNSTVEIGVDNGLNLGGLASATLGNLAGSGALNLGATELNIGQNNAASSVYGGTITGTDGSLVKRGSGSSTLSGTGSSFHHLTVDDGTLVVSGGGLNLTSTNSGPTPALMVLGGAKMNIVGGAVVNANAVDRSSVFVTGANNPQLLIEGAGSRLNGGFQVVIGHTEQGSLTVRQGGELNVSNGLLSGFAGGGSGLISVESGGRATAAVTLVGTLAGAEGRFVVTGPGSTLNSSAQIALGGFGSNQSGGTGHMSILDGGVVTTPETVFWTAPSSITIDRGVLSTGVLRSLGSAGGSIELQADPAGGVALNLTGGSGSASFSGAISGSGSLLKTGGGTQILSGANSFAGSVRVLGGTLEMATGAASEYEVASGALLRLGARDLGFAVVQAPAGASVVYTGSTVNGGQLVGGGSHDIQAVQRLVGTRVATGVTLTPASGASFIGVASSGDILNLAGRSLSWTGGTNSLGSVTVAGSTTVSGWNSSGLLDIRTGGTLVNRGSALVLGGGSRTTIGSVAAPGGLLSLQDGTRLQLNGALLVNNGTISGPVDVNYGSLAKGAGVYGAVTVNDGGRFSPGNSPGTVRGESATWGAGGTYLVELSAAGGTAGRDWDLWALSGGLDIRAGSTGNSRFTIALATLDGSDQAAPLAGFDNQQAYRWQIVDTGSGVSGFDLSTLTLDTSAFRSDTAGGHFQLALDSGDLYVAFVPTPVPEPETWALMLAGMVGIAAASRRRQARAD